MNTGLLSKAVSAMSVSERFFPGLFLVAMILGGAYSAVAADLTVGDRVRIYKSARPGRAYTGVLVSIEGRTLTVRPEGDKGTPLEFDPAELSRVQISNGDHHNLGMGALIGGLTGLVITGIGVATHEDDPDNYNFGPSGGEVILVGTLGFAAVGALVGLAIRTEDWEDLPEPWVTMVPRNGEFRGGLALSW